MSSKAKSIQSLKSEIDQDTNLEQEFPVESAPGHAAIARRAYEIYVERGGADGHDLDDWLQAKRELNRETAVNKQEGI